MTLRPERRRRRLADETNPDQEGEEPARLRIAEGSDRKGGKTSVYGESAQLNQQPRLHEFLPARVLTIVLVNLAALFMLAVLTAVDYWSTALEGVFAPEEVQVLRLVGGKNLGHWYSATLLAWGSLTALFVYSLRRHRVDDYHGRYRIWLLVAASLLLGNLAESTDLGHLSKALGRHAATLSSLPDADVGSFCLLMILAALGIRIGIEVRRSRLAIAAMAVASGLWIASAVLEVGIVSQLSAEVQPLIARICWIAGYVFLLSGLLFYARQIMREIEGTAHVRPARVRRTSKKPPKPAAEDESEEEAEEARSEPSEKPRTASQRGTNAEPATTLSATAAANQSALSRADRRRMRRETKMAS